MVRAAVRLRHRTLRLEVDEAGCRHPVAARKALRRARVGSTAAASCARTITTATATTLTTTRATTRATARARRRIRRVLYLDHPVRGRDVRVIAHLLHHITHVDDDGALDQRHLVPLARLLRLDLQAARRASREHGDEIDVLVGCGAHRAGGLVSVGVAWVVQDAQHGPRVGHAVGERAPRAYLLLDGRADLRRHVIVDPPHQLAPEADQPGPEQLRISRRLFPRELAVRKVALEVVLEVLDEGALGRLGHRHREVPILTLLAAVVLLSKVAGRGGGGAVRRWRRELRGRRVLVERDHEVAPLGVHALYQLVRDGVVGQHGKARGLQRVCELLGGVGRTVVDNSYLELRVDLGGDAVSLHRRKKRQCSEG
mmetsp:Transcript_31984/g.75513  ORF Transcript_31984/g.75513 Transcript_31984/m.75513 type:complete len:370 (+) Transcript_31984:149-1258(+)